MHEREVMGCVQQVEDSCDWFLKEHTDEDDEVKCANGIRVVARALRALMIQLEISHSEEGPLEVELLQRSRKCNDHYHPSIICFNSKGEFHHREILPVSPHAGVIFGGKKISPSDMLKDGIPPKELIQGIRRTLHFMVMGTTANMPSARA